MLAGIFRKEASEVKEEQPNHGKVIETNHDEEVSIRSATKDDPEKKGRTMGTAVRITGVSDPRGGGGE